MRTGQRNRPKFKISRRQVLTVAASAGVGAAAVSVTGLSAAVDSRLAGSAGDQAIVVHLRDPSSGTMDVFVGTSRIEVRDKGLAARLQRAAKG
ncbi:hypothetical protein O7623_16015 [Solwaraspora sp. WMMD791]|uniref:hypothetical protein n=1 Tax=Solwaraspora sp. WMMD791 TaxID=3016086 RepID=UPI00249B40A1|nr:hypothetical protein [Solwaraspora sp. WMMD791]WFE24937.1 hypothetical protein O7623_16015 [Solwaraspora sp. WMMD791]